MQKLLFVKNRLTVVIAIALILLCVMLFYLFYSGTRPVIKIGILHSLSGTMAVSESPLVATEMHKQKSSVRTVGALCYANLAVLQGVRVLGQLQKPVYAAQLAQEFRATAGPVVAREAIQAAMAAWEFSIWFSPRLNPTARVR